jgi:Fe-S cluster biosynthesis and repair protein YggX
MTRTIHCIKHQQEAPGLDAPPYPGALGQRIYDEISQAAWDEWLAHQTMLINEYRLSLVDPKARKFLMEEMEKFLFGVGSEKPSGFTETEPKK